MPKSRVILRLAVFVVLANAFGPGAGAITMTPIDVGVSRLAKSDSSIKMTMASTASGLRSAWMLADPELRLPTSPRTAGEERAQLQDHFRRVEQILIANTPRSLAIAALRFEKTLGRPLTPYERERLLAALFAQRQTQMARLRAYSDAGRFPLNAIPEAPRRPIFLDADGTACAVGYLMSCSGWEKQVASIARTDNFVVVPNVHDGPLVAWVLQSGLTQEEAALIQPFYGPPTHYDGPLSQFMQAGAALQYNGLRFDNFTFSSVQVGAPAVTPSNIQLITNLSDITYDPNHHLNPEGFFHPTGTNFLALHGNLGDTFDVSGGQLSSSGSLLWHLGFDVSVTDSSNAISAVYLTSEQFNMRTIAGIPFSETNDPVSLVAPDGTVLPPRTGDGFFDEFSAQGYAQYQSTVKVGGQPVGSLSLGGSNELNFDPESDLFGSYGLSFAPVRSLHVDMQLLLAGIALSNDITNEFTLVHVPEPGSLVLVGLGLLGLLAYRRRVAKDSGALPRLSQVGPLPTMNRRGTRGQGALKTRVDKPPVAPITSAQSAHQATAASRLARR
jgi:hypothetical protein